MNTTITDTEEKIRDLRLALAEIELRLASYKKAYKILIEQVEFAEGMKSCPDNVYSVLHTGLASAKSFVQKLP